MFDVVWGDPDRELVGEHRAKKELKREQKEKDKEKDKKRGSLSTARSSRSSSDSPFAFLRSHGLKRIATNEANASSKSTASSQLASPSNTSTRSPLSPTFDLTSRRSSGIAPTHTSSDPSYLEGREKDPAGTKKPELGQTSPGLSRHDSVFSKYADSEAESPSFLSKRLGRQLPSAPTTSPVFESQPAALLTEQSRSVVNDLDTQSVDSGGVRNRDLTTTPSKALRMALQEQTCVQVECHDSSRLATSHLDTHIASKQSHRPSSPNMSQKPHEANVSLHDKSTLDQDLDNIQDGKSVLDQLPPLAFDTLSGVESWRQYITRFTKLNDEQLLSEFTILSFLEPCLASHEETELKLRLMMLWALDNLDPVLGATRPGRHWATIPSPTGASHLAFYETQETAAYLAANSPEHEISHLSPSPLTTQFSPNIRSLSTQPSGSLHITSGPGSFDTVSCLRLPTISPQAEIPGMFARIARCLKPGGTLQLTLVDPLPLPGTLGPHMRSWLQNNLITNLEKNQRCSNPRKAFPPWLADAGLRGQGSSLTTTKFYAIPTCVVNSRKCLLEESGLPIGKACHEKLVKAEIRSHIGRLLWAEVWGPFVTASKWWWEDPVCVEECVELKTIWKYYFIESRKG